MSPELSVVVPFYGVEDYFAACLESIRRQRLQDIEVILVDDGSLDGSRAIAETFVALDPRFTLVTQENAGLGPARNTGTSHATGEYLTFVDSDDLVSAGGFETMVGMLNSSGSSLAGGNARRFNNSSGIRQSWSHRQAFAETQVATHILELPVLARDRMVWNKVYRRSFWDEYGYAFPAIRYEDYPVTFKAHLDAVTVDVLSDPIYYWRERESGDSITQQAYRYDNLLDRVVSAEMVLDQADRSSPAVRFEVYDALKDSDFVTIVQAFATVPDSDLASLLALGERLADRLGERALDHGHPYTFLQYRALRAGDADLLRELAEFRGGGGLQGRARGSRHPSLPWRLEFPYPGLGSASVPRSMYAVPRDQVSLRTTVADVVDRDGDLVLRGTAEVRHHRSGEDARVEMRVGGGRRWHPLDVTLRDAQDSHGDISRVGFEVVLDAALLATLEAAGDPVSQIEVTVHAGRTTRKGRLHGAGPGAPQWTPSVRVGDDVWAQPATTSKRHFVVSWLRSPWTLTHVEARDRGLRLTVTGSGTLGPSPTLRVDARAGSTDADLVFPGTPLPGEDGRPAEVVVDIAVADVVGSISGDDPFLHQSVRGLALDPGLPGEEAPQLLLWRAPEHGVGTTLGQHLVRITRSPGNRVNLIESPVRLVAETAGVQDGELVVGGKDWTASTELHVAWRQYLPNSDDYIEQASELVAGDGTWSLRTPLSPLLETTADALDLQHRGEWVLFCAWDGRDAAAVVPDPFLLTRLPLVEVAGSRTGTLLPIGETLHFRVSDRG